MRFGLIADHQIRVHMRLYAPGCVDFGGVNLKPIGGRFAHQISCAAHIGDLRDGLFGSDTVRHFHQGAFSVAVKQQIGFGIDQDGTTHFVLPIIVMRNAA